MWNYISPSEAVKGGGGIMGVVMFITIDGGDGCGKTTQQQRLCEWLRSMGRDVVLCRDPGGTELGDKVREIVLNGGVGICNVAEMFLFMASRAQLVEEVIRPSVLAGKDVISDRFLISNIVYQGYAGGVSIEEVESSGRIATSGILPDVGIILDVPYEVGVGRIGERAKDRMERKGEEYHKRVRNGFLEYAQKNRLYVVIDAVPPPEEVEQEIRKILLKQGNF
ncbi:MAG: dTMP kinase [Planctomycetaceae bacterium]|nr:dTMP kinase [Planctomycetaceae bacterium]